MLATCLKYNSIKNFLFNYDESRWCKLIPSLLEIAILNLNISFKRSFFTEKDLDIIVDDLKSTLSKKPKNPKKNNLDDLIYGHNSNNNKTRKKNNNKENIEINKQNIINKKNIRAAKSKISKDVEKDKQNYYRNKSRDKSRDMENESEKSETNNNIKKNKNKNRTNYAISYDKNLEMEMIEKTEINKKKGV